MIAFWTTFERRSRTMRSSVVICASCRLPATRSSLPAGFKWKWQGRNDGGSIGYTGPCPPAGPRHHYVFTLYAVDRRLAVPRGASPSVVISAVVRHTRSTATLVGVYSR